MSARALKWNNGQITNHAQHRPCAAFFANRGWLTPWQYFVQRTVRPLVQITSVERDVHNLSEGYLRAVEGRPYCRAVIARPNYETGQAQLPKATRKTSVSSNSDIKKDEAAGQVTTPQATRENPESSNSDIKEETRSPLPTPTSSASKVNPHHHAQQGRASSSKSEMREKVMMEFFHRIGKTTATAARQPRDVELGGLKAGASSFETKDSVEASCPIVSWTMWPLYQNPHNTWLSIGATSDLGLFCDPESDECKLGNFSQAQVLVIRLSLPEMPQSQLPKNGIMRIQPGMWRVKTKTPDGDDIQCDFLSMTRPYITKQRPPKREAPDTETSSHKRWKRDEAEATQQGGYETVSQLREPSESRKGKEVDGSSRHQPSMCSERGATLTIRDTSTYGSNDPGNRCSPADYTTEVAENVKDTDKACRFFFCGHPKLPGRTVFAKVFRPDPSRPPGVLATSSDLWQREINALHQLSHPNIVRLEAYDGRLLALYMEHIPPGLHLQMPLARRDAIRMMRDIASALTYMNMKGLVHNNVKPSHIAYSQTRGAVLFGFSQALTISEGEKRYGTKEGARGPAQDVLELGVTLLMALGLLRVNRGNEVFVDEQSRARAARAWLEDIQKIRSELQPDDTFERVISAALELRPSKRISAAAIYAELLECDV